MSILKSILNGYSPYRAVHVWLMTSKHTVPDLEMREGVKEEALRHFLSTQHEEHPKVRLVDDGNYIP